MKALLRLRSISLASFTTLALMGCVSDGDDSNQQVAGGGVTGTGVSYGTVTGFGSVFVNGVKYSTDAASITLDDNPGIESDLRVGMVVKVEGSINDDGATGVAKTISYNDILEGVVNAQPDISTNTFIAMGQTVKFNNLTVFEDKTVFPASIGTFVASTGDILVGNVVEVSGWVDGGGVVNASRIERKSHAFVENGINELEIKGKVFGLDELNKSFMIGSLRIDYSAAISMPGVLTNGSLVEVKSRKSLVAGPTMIALQVEREAQPLEGLVSGWVEVEGYVTAQISSSDFTVLGVRVTASDSTSYENGLASDIVLGAKLEIKGVMNSDGILNARHISFKLPNNVKIEAEVESVDPAAKIVTLLGIKVGVNSSSQLEDDSKHDVQSFSLDDLRAGDFVEIRAFMRAGNVIASRLERDDSDDEVILQGPITEKEGDNSSLTILGVKINTSSVYGTSYYLLGGAGTSQGIFYRQLIENSSVVKAKGDLDVNGEIGAEEVKIEN